MIRKFVLATSLLVTASVSYAEERLGILQVETPLSEIGLTVFPEEGDATSTWQPATGGVIRFEAVIDLEADGEGPNQEANGNWYGYQPPATLSAKLVLPGVSGELELGGGGVQTIERDESNPFQGSWFKDQINVNRRLSESERFTIDTPFEGEEDFTVMAIDVQTSNYSSSNPSLLESTDLAANKSGQFQFSAGRVELRVFFIEFYQSGEQSGEFKRLLEVVGFKDVVSVDADQDGVQDADDLCESTLSGSVVDASGCSVQQYCYCEADWKNHGQMVACTSSVAEIFVSEGLLTDDEKDSVVGEAARSSCGKPAKGKK